MLKYIQYTVISNTKDYKEYIANKCISRIVPFAIAETNAFEICSVDLIV